MSLSSGNTSSEKETYITTTNQTSQRGTTMRVKLREISEMSMRAARAPKRWLTCPTKLRIVGLFRSLTSQTRRTVETRVKTQKHSIVVPRYASLVDDSSVATWSNPIAPPFIKMISLISLISLISSFLSFLQELILVWSF